MVKELTEDQIRIYIDTVQVYEVLNISMRLLNPLPAYLFDGAGNGSTYSAMIFSGTNFWNLDCSER